MTWNHFPYFALVAVLLWAVGAYCGVLNKLTLYLKQKKVKKHGKVQ